MSFLNIWIIVAFGQVPEIVIGVALNLASAAGDSIVAPVVGGSAGTIPVRLIELGIGGGL